MGPDAPQRTLRREGRRRRGGLGVFLLASAVPVAGAVALVVLPAGTREPLLARIPPGVGGRALAAGVAFGAMALLAWVALPAFHNASGVLAGLGAGLGRRGRLVRLVLLPFEAILGFGWLALQALFALDVFLILATGLAGLLLAVRIADPSFLPGVLPNLGR